MMEGCVLDRELLESDDGRLFGSTRPRVVRNCRTTDTGRDERGTLSVREIGSRLVLLDIEDPVRIFFYCNLEPSI